MNNTSKIILFLLLAFATSAFVQQNNSAVLKGKLKRVDVFMSGTHSDYLYDDLGHLKSVIYPYGRSATFTYSNNLVYADHIEPSGKNYLDTLMVKNGRLESVLGKPSIWITEYDEKGNIISQKYVTRKSKKGKSSKSGFTYFYDHYPEQWDSITIDLWACECPIKDGRNLLKTAVGINAKGDTTYYFRYKYGFDKEGRVKGRTGYYRTGQLYDSIGFCYY